MYGWRARCRNPVKVGPRQAASVELRGWRRGEKGGTRTPKAFPGIPQGCIKRMELRSDDGPILWLFSIVLVLVLAVVLEGKGGKIEHEDEDDDENYGQRTLRTKDRSLGSVGQSELHAALGIPRRALFMLLKGAGFRARFGSRQMRIRLCE